MRFKFDPKELTKEKSLWEIYKSSRSIKTSLFNKLVLVISAILLIGYAYFETDANLLLINSRNIAELGLSFSVSILGFLIAGFTIFATLTKPFMLLKMMDITHSDSGLPHLKYNFFVFMRVFIFYLCISFIFLIVTLFCNKSGLVSRIISVLPEANLSRLYVIKISYVFLALCVIYLILLLKNFIFNIYTIVMNHLRWVHYGWKENETNDSDIEDPSKLG